MTKSFIRAMSDQETVAAINSCLDFAKLNQLPDEAILRFKELMKGRRIGAVCFFTSVGFGLKVNRPIPLTDDEIKYSGDECSIDDGVKNKAWRIDLDSYWLRCPGELILDLTTEIKGEYQIRDEYGNRVLTGFKWEGGVVVKPKWTDYRYDGILFTMEEASEIIASPHVKGVIVKVSPSPSDMVKTRRKMVERMSNGWSFNSPVLPKDHKDEDKEEIDEDEEDVEDDE